MATVHLMQSPEVEGWTRDDWNTPKYILDAVEAFGSIGLDPCSNATSLVPAAHRWTREDDALSRDWRCLGLVFVNPPYSRGLYTRFAEKIADEAARGVEIVALVPANCETTAWTNYLWQEAAAVCFLGKRVRFLRDGAPRGVSPGCSALVYFGSREDAFAAAVGRLGQVVFT